MWSHKCQKEGSNASTDLLATFWYRLLYNWPSSLQSYTTDSCSACAFVCCPAKLSSGHPEASLYCYAWFFVEFNEISVRPFLQTVEVSLNRSFPILHSIDPCPSVWYHLSVCWGSILFHCPCHKDIKQHQPQLTALNNATNNQPRAGLNIIDQNLLNLTAQPIFCPSN